MDAFQIEILRTEVIARYAVYVKAEKFLSHAKKEWLDAESKWQDALLEYANELQERKKIKKKFD
jgi:hypothetical protein